MPHASPTARHHAGHTQHQQHQRQPSPPLDKSEREAETCRLARIVQSSERGSAEWIAARNRIVELHLKLVGHVVSRFISAGCWDSDELFQDGSTGLIAAAERFDPERGNGFSKMAMLWIRGHIRDGLRLRSMIWIPRSCRDITFADRRVAALSDEVAIALADDKPNAEAEVDDADFFSVAIKRLQSRIPESDYRLLAENFGLGNRMPRSAAAIGRDTGEGRQAVGNRIFRMLPKLKQHVKPLYDQLEEVA